MATVNITDYLGIDGNVDNWNFKENFVQDDENQGTAGSFIAAESTLICGGPAKATDNLVVTKIGLTPSIQISENIPQQRIYEIGSKRCHIVNGIPVGGFSISRMISNGPSLLRLLYGRLFDASGNITAYGSQGLTTSEKAIQQKLVSAWNNLTLTQDRVMAGHADTDLWLSLFDQRFMLPFGLAVFMQDVSGNAVGGVYYEGCKVNSSQYGQSSGQMVMMQGLSVAFDRSVPIVHGVGSKF